MISVENYLRKNGPSLSSDITESLVNNHGVLAATARKRVSRGGSEVLKLDLSFPRNAKFLFLREQSGSNEYWSNLVDALLKSNSAYGYAILSLQARNGVMPLSHFEIVCGSPIKQKKHLAASVVLERLISVNLVKTIEVTKLGKCIYLSVHSNRIESLLPGLKARLLAESILLRGFESWLKKNNFVSYNQVKTRDFVPNPTVSTTAWDLCGPSYLSPLVTFSSVGTQPKPGFVTCDVLINDKVYDSALAPYLKKVNSLRSLKNVGRTLHFFIAKSYDSDAFSHLKAEGISPATIQSIFGREVSDGISEVLSIFTDLIPNSGLDLSSLDKIFNILGKVEGAASRIRGAFFEYLIADIVKSSVSCHSVDMNRICKSAKLDIAGKRQEAEADVICVTNDNQVIFIEGKGYSPKAEISREIVNDWLVRQVPIFFDYCRNHPDWNNKKFVFKFWTSSTFSEEAIALLKEMKSSISPKKYSLDYLNGSDIDTLIKSTSNTQLLKIYREHFSKHPLNNI
ncbi:hypothetical protein [Shewanella colwelliana]|uniref:hypothetical protein n=1 Tax=Shewanella colwelliana TaxID=23 RepID=UPI0022B00290|nr:hypothetical protein [Shewanella colwelliana]MCZ4339861.1 hypothetical protein [Shewanella colwelliana]